MDGLRQQGLGDYAGFKFPQPCAGVDFQHRTKVLDGTLTAKAKKKAKYEAFEAMLDDLLVKAKEHGVTSAKCILPCRLGGDLASSSTWSDVDATHALADLIDHSEGLVLYGVEVLEGFALLLTSAPVAYIHLPDAGVYDALRVGNTKRCELRSLTSTSWTQDGKKPKNGSISAGDLRVEDIVVFFTTDAEGSVMGAFAARISWRCVSVKK